MRRSPSASGGACETRRSASCGPPTDGEIYAFLGEASHAVGGVQAEAQAAVLLSQRLERADHQAVTMNEADHHLSLQLRGAPAGILPGLADGVDLRGSARRTTSPSGVSETA